MKLDFEVDETACEELPPLPSIRVLLADDDRPPAGRPEYSLDELGMDGDTACGGLEALERQEKRVGPADYRIVFLDWRMPDMDGVSVVRKLRAELGEAVSVFIISAYDWTGTGEARSGRERIYQETVFRSHPVQAAGAVFVRGGGAGAAGTARHA